MSKKQQFLISIIVVLIYPLVPLGVEASSRGTVLDTTLLLTACIYSITVFTSSNNLVYVFLSVLPGIGLLLLYSMSLKKEIVECSNGMLSIFQNGVCVKESMSPIQVVHHEKSHILTAIAAILIVAVLHGIERHKRHYLLDEEFLPIKKQEKK